MAALGHPMAVSYPVTAPALQKTMRLKRVALALATAAVGRLMVVLYQRTHLAHQNQTKERCVVFTVKPYLGTDKLTYFYSKS